MIKLDIFYFLCKPSAKEEVLWLQYFLSMITQYVAQVFSDHSCVIMKIVLYCPFCCSFTTVKALTIPQRTHHSQQTTHHENVWRMPFPSSHNNAHTHLPCSDSQMQSLLMYIMGCYHIKWSTLVLAYHSQTCQTVSLHLAILPWFYLYCDTYIRGL